MTKKLPTREEELRRLDLGPLPPGFLERFIEEMKDSDLKAPIPTGPNANEIRIAEELKTQP